MRISIAVFLVLASLATFGYRGYQKTIFTQNVTGYLVHAANASSIEIAREELGKALGYLEANNLTSGYTSVLYNTPDEDITFWYKNLKASYDALDGAKEATSLEKTNLLLKLRETIMHNGGEGKEKITAPDAIYLHPNNVMWGWGTFLAIVGLVAGLLLFIPEEEWKKANATANDAK